jgi:hypothetical protein
MVRPRGPIVESLGYRSASRSTFHNGGVAALNKLMSQAFARRLVFPGLALPLDVAPASRSLVENMIGGLNQACGLKFAQIVARANQAHPFVDDRATLPHVAVLEQQQGYSGEVSVTMRLNGLLMPAGISGLYESARGRVVAPRHLAPPSPRQGGEGQVRRVQPTPRHNFRSPDPAASSK